MKIQLVRIRLNQGGYTDKGQYFGIGLPLYEYWNDDVHDYIRAYDREHAKAQIRAIFPNAKFYR